MLRYVSKPETRNVSKTVLFQDTFLGMCILFPYTKRMYKGNSKGHTQHNFVETILYIWIFFLIFWNSPICVLQAVIKLLASSHIEKGLFQEPPFVGYDGKIPPRCCHVVPIFLHIVRFISNGSHLQGVSASAKLMQHQKCVFNNIST